ncbi:glutathione S-transferase 2-like [Pectinophora gossypiella]|nr:glutathione S-transferase 2-like [Pectinophora gossypiella]
MWACVLWQSFWSPVCCWCLCTEHVLYSKMPKVVFTYFPLKGLGESGRLLLAYGGQEFEDRRITKDEWPEHKPKTPFGQLPVLEIDGKQYAQSVSIARYLGHKFGVAGADIEEDFEIDQNVEFLNDIRFKMVAVAHEPDPEVKKRKHEENVKNVYPGLLKKLNEIITKNNGHLALGKLTWGDFVLAGIYETMKKMLEIPDMDSQYPALKQLVDSVNSLPGVKEFIAQAPPSEF